MSQIWTNDSTAQVAIKLGSSEDQLRSLERKREGERERKRKKERKRKRGERERGIGEIRYDNTLNT